MGSSYLNEILKIAKHHGAKLILFTSEKNSALAPQADAVLVSVCPELMHNTELKASLAKLIYMALGDIIYTRLTLLRPQQYRDNLQKLNSYLTMIEA